MISRREWTQHILLKSLCSPKREEVNNKIIADIKPEYFSSNLYRKSLRLVKQHYDDTGDFYTWSELIGLPELGTKNATKLKALELRRLKLKQTDDSLNLPSNEKQYTTFIKRTLHDAKHLKLIELQNELSEGLQVDDMTTESLEPLLDLVKATVQEIDTFKVNRGSLFEINDKNAKSKIKELYHNMKNNFIIPTGFTAFDNVNMGIPLDSLFVIAAKSGCGKSSMLLQYFINARKQGARCCLLPLEMSEEQMLIRLASNLLEIPANELLKGLKKYYKKIIKAIREFCAPLNNNDPGCIHFYMPEMGETLPDVLEKLQTYKYDIIGVDYLNLLTQTSTEKWESLYNDSAYAKRFASKNRTQVVLLAQLDDKTDDIRYSKGLKEHACVIADSFITTSTGFIRFEDIINVNDEKGFHKLAKPIEVITECNQITTVDTYYVNGKAPVFRITQDDGNYHICTENHKFKVLQDSQLYWKEVKTLKVGDCLIQNKYHKFNNSIQTITIGNEVIECNNNIAKMLGKILSNSTDIDYINPMLYNIPGISKNNHECYVPDQIMNSPEYIIRDFIKTVITFNVYTSNSPEMLRRLQLLLNRLDISCSVEGDKLYIDINDFVPNVRHIISIELVGYEMTYDLVVPVTHNYVLNGMVSHNSNMWTWNQQVQDIMENQRVDINQIKARNQNPVPFPLKTDLACSKFSDWIEDMGSSKPYKKKDKSLSKGFDSTGSDVPDD
jgi:KaiC/GvpD/RAD55 family RecA-like ATPase